MLIKFLATFRPQDDSRSGKCYTKKTRCKEKKINSKNNNKNELKKTEKNNSNRCQYKANKQKPEQESSAKFTTMSNKIVQYHRAECIGHCPKEGWSIELYTHVAKWEHKKRWNSAISQSRVHWTLPQKREGHWGCTLMRLSESTKNKPKPSQCTIKLSWRTRSKGPSEPWMKVGGYPSIQSITKTITNKIGLVNKNGNWHAEMCIKQT